jgi:hypothetical protein
MFLHKRKRVNKKDKKDDDMRWAIIHSSKTNENVSRERDITHIVAHLLVSISAVYQPVMSHECK